MRESLQLQTSITHVFHFTIGWQIVLHKGFCTTKTLQRKIFWKPLLALFVCILKMHRSEVSCLGTESRNKPLTSSSVIHRTTFLLHIQFLVNELVDTDDDGDGDNDGDDDDYNNDAGVQKVLDVTITRFPCSRISQILNLM